MPGSVIWWLAAIILFLAVEAGTVALVSIWFSGGALLALIAALLGASPLVQWAVFVLSSGLLLAVSWPWIRKRARTKPVRTNADRLIGRELLVVEPIDNLAGTGAVRADGVLWTAKNVHPEPVAAGALVTVERIEGSKLYVSPVHAPSSAAK